MKKTKSHRLSKEESTKQRQRIYQPTESKNKHYSNSQALFFKELFLALAGGSILVVGLTLMVVSILTIQGFSMVPTLREGDKVLIRKQGDLKRFDLVAFTVGGKGPQVRRIIGLPGETVRYADDTLYINEQPVDEKFLVEAINESQKNGRNYTEDFEQKTVVIPEGYYFVLGDNRPYANDSRQYGFVAKDRVLGKVIAKLFPFNELESF
ncbi:signal peptidase I [Enterococcus plantarum]|uniref:Signal peptidase I n=1 Tax=Enterococcus plantarum TaxID=1077675 RepID=A0A2W3ZCD5_9ENTE|nr:signal peptidase I [Enterococcus plantarum]PZL74890.1 signal peptidase I [Enterococcus plantarum]